jgi:hypothetical protein
MMTATVGRQDKPLTSKLGTVSAVDALNEVIC